MLNFFVHFKELKTKIIYIIISFISTFGTSYINVSQLISILITPFNDIIKTNFIVTDVFEVFNTYVILSMYICVFLVIPVILYYLYNFIKPGLYKYEKNIILMCFSVFLTNLYLSTYFSFSTLFPTILSFLLSLNLIVSPIFLEIDMQPKIYDYISTLCYFAFIYGFVIFQIPAFLCLSIFVNNIKPYTLYNKRRLTIFVCFMIGSIFSSPDIYCLLLITLPLIILFEMVTFLTIVMNKYNNKFCENSLMD